MRRLHLLVLGPAWAVACASPPRGAVTPTAAGVTDAERTALQMGDRVLADWFERNPERATLLRPPGTTFDTLEDDSLAAVAKRNAQYDAWDAELRSIDPKGLAGNTTAVLSYDVAKDLLEGEIGKRVCRDELWTVSPTGNGWVQSFAVYAEVQPVGTDALRKQAIARFGKMAAYGDAQIEALREGQRLGYLAYAGSVRAVLDQLDKLLATPADKSAFLAPAERDGTPEFKAHLTSVLADGFLPAVRRYRDFLANEYLPHARATPGVGVIPRGDACYRADLRAITTLDLDPKQVHQTGWAELAKIEAEMKALSDKSFGGADIRALLDRFRSDPAYRYKDRDDMVTQAKATIAKARAAMPRAFGLLPPDDVTVEPIPLFLEKSSAHHYEMAALDGSRPATYRIRLYQPEQQSRVLGESTAFHETIPGHHLQIDIAAHRPDVPPIARYLFNSGYVEGWGLYAERLADELGLYSSDADRMGMLSNRAWRAVRLIVDTGIHALGWDRQKAVDTMLAHTAASPDFASAEVDRYIAWPGQACAYMIGYLEILRLREEAQKALGPRFDLRAFDDRVLEDGSVPLPLLRENIEIWIRRQVALPSPR